MWEQQMLCRPAMRPWRQRRAFSTFYTFRAFPRSPFPTQPPTYQRNALRRRPFLFTVGAVTGIYVGCSLIANMQDIHRAKSAFRFQTLPAWDDLQRAKRALGKVWDRVLSMTTPPAETQFAPAWLRDNMVSDVWRRSSDAQKCIYSLIAVNVAVFGLFTVVPRLAMRAAPYFVTTPGSSPSSSLLLSCFSHGSLAHLGFNMMALYSFGPALAHSPVMGGSPWAFLAFYCSTGILSSLAQQSMTLLRFKRGLIQQLPGALGASGALYGVLGAVAMLMPNATVRLLFIPIDLPILPTFGCLMGVDLIGGLLGWSVFGHWVCLLSCFSKGMCH